MFELCVVCLCFVLVGVCVGVCVGVLFVFGVLSFQCVVCVGVLFV